MTRYSVLLKSFEYKTSKQSNGGTSRIHFHYIVDDGELQRFPLYGNRLMKKGDVWKIGLLLNYSSKIIIAFEENVSLFEDIDLGTITIYNSTLNKRQLFTNSTTKQSYELSYISKSLLPPELAVNNSFADKMEAHQVKLCLNHS